MQSHRPSRTFLMITLGLSAAVVATAQSITFEEVAKIAGTLGAFNLKINPRFEREEKQEIALTLGVAKNMFRVQMATEPQSRDAHAKGHGCVRAELKIESQIPKSIQAGLFAQSGMTFEAVIRYSNGSGTTKPDAIPDGRGMAMKVLNGAPRGNLLGTGTTQDFMMIQSPRFFIGSLRDYKLFGEAIIQDKKPDRFFLERAIRETLSEAKIATAEEVESKDLVPIMSGIAQLTTDSNPLKQAIFNLFPNQAQPIFMGLLGKIGAMKKGEAPQELKIAREVSKSIGSSLSESYFSMSSYLLNAPSNPTAVKYSARPVDCNTGKSINPSPAPATVSSEGFLREDLNQSLAQDARCFDFLVQALPASVDDTTRITLVEDPRLNFETPEIKVARIKIPPQNFDSPEKQKFCENLSYNPWQSDADHQPLGALNRARKVAVTISSIRRHLVSGADRSEPTSLEILK